MLTDGRKAFTLIELLVVIAIIAILAAILFPVFMTAKRAGQGNACMANTKRLGLASVMYADDNGGFLVPVITGEYDKDYPAYPNRRYWSKTLFPYVKSASAYLCPTMASRDWEATPFNGPSQSMATNYAIYGYVVSCDSDQQGHRGRSMSEYSKTSRIILICETRRGWWSTGPEIMDWYDPVWNLKNYAPCWHNGKLSIAFLDGHARTMYMYDTIGDAPSQWMWTDPNVNGGSLDGIAKAQSDFRANWPHDYPPFAEYTPTKQWVTGAIP